MLVLLLLLLALHVGVSAHEDDVGFRSGIQTAATVSPWTNLDFYADPGNFQFAIVSDRTGGRRSGFFPTPSTA